ncbi:MAG: hypothetical protein AAF447_09350 [Myxococcota bacterium]
MLRHRLGLATPLLGAVREVELPDAFLVSGVAVERRGKAAREHGRDLRDSVQAKVQLFEARDGEQGADVRELVARRVDLREAPAFESREGHEHVAGDIEVLGGRSEPLRIPLVLTVRR